MNSETFSLTAQKKTRKKEIYCILILFVWAAFILLIVDTVTVISFFLEIQFCCSIQWVSSEQCTVRNWLGQHLSQFHCRSIKQISYQNIDFSRLFRFPFTSTSICAMNRKMIAFSNNNNNQQINISNWFRSILLINGIWSASINFEPFVKNTVYFSFPELRKK